MISNSQGYYEYLPQNYNSESGTYPLLVFLHGIGELGDGSNGELKRVLANGTPKLIDAGTFPTSFTVNGETFKFIVITPQFMNWPSTPDVQGVIDYCVRNYRVNTSKIYLTGLSMGGGAVWDYAGASMDNANRLAAIVPVCGVSGPIDERINVLTRAALPIWGTHNLYDNDVTSSNTIGYIDKIAALNLLLNPLSLLNFNPIAKKTIFNVNGHDAWSTTYSPSFKENNMNVYEWMLQFSRNGSAPANPAPPPTQNQSPTSSAGADQWISLPTNSVTLSGSGRDQDGSITNYSWTKISGPSQYNINYGNIANPTISNLTEGTYSFRLTVTDNGGATASDDVTVIVSPSSNIVAPPTGAVSIPGKIEAENYSTMFGVINEKTTDDGGGQDVGWIEYYDWMNYSVNVTTAGSYTVNFRVASINGGAQLQLKSSDGTILATVTVPKTGGFQAWTTISATVNLKAGAQTFTVFSTQNGGWNINWFEFTAATSAPSGPSGGSSYAPIPGKIEAENYSNMYGVMTESTADTNGGQDVGWIENGDWMDFNVSVGSAGNYNVNFRVASPNANQQLQVKNASGNVLATLNIPQTGGFQTWRTVTVPLYLFAGNQTIRIYSNQNGWWNINWMEFVSGQSAAITLPGYSAIPGKIESESYSSSYGVITESTADAGGGSDVGWIELGDWMEYSVNVATAGNYNVNFRVASPNVNQQLQVRNSSGGVLSTVNIPQTGGFQTWRTVTAQMYLFAGSQTIRVYSMNGWWNINWMEFTLGSSASDAATESGRITSGVIASSDNIPVTQQVFSIYPNPVNKVFNMQIKNNYTGTMDVQVVNLAGAIVKQFKLAKGTTVSQVTLPVDELTKGTYFIKVQIGKWSDTKKMTKL